MGKKSAFFKKVLYYCDKCEKEIGEKNGYYIEDVKIICDETNNIENDIKNGYLNIDIYVKCVPVLEKIELGFVI